MKDAIGVELAVGDRVVVYDTAWIAGKSSHGVYWATVVRFTNNRVGVTYDLADGNYRTNVLRQPHQVMFISR
jgi:hypothetical protein